MANAVFDHLRTGLINGSLNLSADTLKVVLVQETNPTIVTSSANVSSTMSTEYSGTSGTSLSETSGANYTAGGQALSNTLLVNDGTNIGLSASNNTWSNSTITAGGALLYKDTGVYPNGSLPLVYFDFVASRISTNGDFTLEWTSEGLINITS